MSPGRRPPLHVEERGTVGRPLVLVHGFGGTGHTWRHWIPELSRSRRVLVVDLKGHGRAPKPPDDRYGPFNQAGYLARMIRDRGLEDAVLVGHSLGGGIVMKAALDLRAERPQSLAALILVSAAVQPQAIPRYIGWARRPVLGRLFFALVPPRVLIRRALRYIVHDPSTIDEDQIEAYADPLMTPEGRRAARLGARRIIPPDAEAVMARYPSIDLPTLLLWGKEDPVVPVELARDLLETLPRARLEVLDDCGHLPQEERPATSLGPVLTFLEELDRDDGPAIRSRDEPRSGDEQKRDALEASSADDAKGQEGGGSEEGGGGSEGDGR